MSRLLALTVSFVSALVAVGCPVYGDGCDRDSDCAAGYECRNDSCIQVSSPAPGPGRCRSSEECSQGEVCDRFNRCVPTTPGGAGESGGGAAGAAGAAQ